MQERYTYKNITINKDTNSVEANDIKNTVVEGEAEKKPRRGRKKKSEGVDNG